MNRKPIHEFNFSSLLAMLLGVIAFSLFVGFETLHPENVQWMMAGWDTPTYYLGWAFFRKSDFWQIPLGANLDYGMALGSSIVYSDSLPLFALFFKPLDPFLPQQFQYFGFWLLTCFVLQSYFACRLLGCFIENKSIMLVGSVFFLIAPIFLVRVKMHHGLAGQWLVIAGMFFYFSKTFSPRKWFVILTIAILIHAYIFVLVFSLWCADLFQQYLKKSKSFFELAIFLATSLLLVTASMYMAGYFLLTGSIEVSLRSFGRLNLLALIDSNNSWSIFLPDIPSSFLDKHTYLGFGIILLSGLAVYCLTKYGQRYKIWTALQKNKNTIIPMAMLAIFLFFVSLSNVVALGGEILFTYQPPLFLEKLFTTFRSPARMIWPVYYLIILVAIVSIYKCFSRQFALAIIAFSLVLQLVDFSGIFIDWVTKPIGLQKWSTPLVSPAWGELVTNYSEIRYLLPTNNPPGYAPLAYIAQTNGMKINFGHFARIDEEMLAFERKRLFDNLLSDAGLEHALYVIPDEKLWRFASLKAKPNDFVGIINGYNVIAPGPLQCENCALIALENVEKKGPHNSSALVPLAEPISFDKYGSGQNHLLAGWSNPESWGIWSEGDESSLYFQLPANLKYDLKLVFQASGHISKSVSLQKVNVMANGIMVGQFRFTEKDNEAGELIVPSEILRQRKNVLLLQFKIASPHAPATADNRKLGIGLRTLEFREIKLTKQPPAEAGGFE